MDTILSGRDVLVVDDEPLLRKRLKRFLEGEGANVIAAASFEEGRSALTSMLFDYAMLDVHLPDGLGVDLLDAASGVICVIMTADGGWETAVEAMKRGAADYMTKPFELEEVPLILGRCANARRSRRSREHRLEMEAGGGDGEELFFGESLAELKKNLERILESDRRLSEKLPPILLEGETGTGKSTFAKWFHAKGSRSDRELVVVNCAALPDSLAESELFGHEKGAFTDAKEKRIGLFEAADGGTLFLDEIASLSPALQSKALLAIEEGSIRRLGGTREISVDARVIAASNRNLWKLVEEGVFREDLYHRLNLLHVKIPPLRERKEDLELLVEHVGARLARRYGIGSFKLSARGKEQLNAHDWPGNIRELAHEVERSIILGDPKDAEFPALVYDLEQAVEEGPGDPSDWLNPRWNFPEEGIDLEGAIDRLIGRAIDKVGGNVTAAARLLGVSRDYIRYRKKKRPN